MQTDLDTIAKTVGVAARFVWTWTDADLEPMIAT